MPTKTGQKPTHSVSLAVALDAADWLRVADLASTQLAQSLAELLDNGRLDGRDLLAAMRLYADVLQSLGLSVDGRAGKPNPSPTKESPLDEIKKRANRQPSTTVGKPAAKRSKSGR